MTATKQCLSPSRVQIPRLAQILLLLVLALSGCSRKASDEIDAGSITDSVYTNKYFGMSVTLPSDWSVQDQESQRRLQHLGEKIVAGDDKSMASALEAEEPQIVSMFALYKQPLGSPVKFNPSFLAEAERVRQAPGIKTGRDYLFLARQMLESGQMKVSFPKDIYTEQVGGIDFDVLNAQMSIRGITIQQRYYATIKKGYALGFVISFIGDEKDPAQQKTLESVTFK